MLSSSKVVLNENSTVMLTNSFSERSTFNSIHSYRVCMSFLAIVDFSFLDLEVESVRGVVDFFNKAVAENQDALFCSFDYIDFVDAWAVASSRRTKKHLKDLSQKLLLQCFIKEGDELISLFSRAILCEDKIKVWLNPFAMPYLLNAHKASSGFISPIPLMYFRTFKSTATAKIFERMLRFIDTGTLYLTLDSIREITGSKSEEYKSIKRDVLLKAKTELEALSFVERFDITEKKEGRRVKSVVISFSMPEIKRLKRKN